jgi:hypothetical protein
LFNEAVRREGKGRMGQRCTKKDLDDYDDDEHDDDHDDAMVSESDDEFDTKAADRSDDEAAGRPTPGSPNAAERDVSNSNDDFSNQFRRKDNRVRALSEDAKKRRASNYNDVHIQVSEQLRQFEDENAQAALSRDYRPMGVVGLQNLVCAVPSIASRRGYAACFLSQFCFPPCKS